MNSPTDTAVASRLRSMLLELAREEDDLAAAEAAVTPYWSPIPSTVLGHRTAASVLRAQAEMVA